MSFGQSMAFGQEVKARAAVESELRTAHDMQMGLMPKEDPRVNGFEISGSCLPANEVGGDYFDYVWLDQKKTKLGIAIADVSGKAMKAAITAVMTSGMIYREIENDDTPRSILRKINRPMYLKTDRQVFTAMSFAVIDAKKKVLRFSNAGQSQPMLVRGEKLSYIKVRGARLPLGVMAEQNYLEASVKLKSGDILLFYTDGLPEATNAEHRLLGFEAVEEELMKRRMSSATDIVLGMTELVNRHTGKTEQHDDMTVVVVKVA
jgi:sigma-B regulation protein RsbU (phosphoserine phosphatase)